MSKYSPAPANGNTMVRDSKRQTDDYDRVSNYNKNAYKADMSHLALSLLVKNALL
jgi:hypothetical protein